MQKAPRLIQHYVEFEVCQALLRYFFGQANSANFPKNRFLHESILSKVKKFPSQNPYQIGFYYDKHINFYYQTPKFGGSKTL